MDFDNDEDPWKRASPIAELSQPAVTAASSSSNADWDADSDDDGKGDNFIDETSRLSLSMMRNGDGNEIDNDNAEDGDSNGTAFEDASQGNTVPSTPVVETSSAPSSLSTKPTSDAKVVPSLSVAPPSSTSSFLAPPGSSSTAFESSNTMDDFEDDDDGFGEPSGSRTQGPSGSISAGPVHTSEGAFTSGQNNAGFDDDDDFGDFGEETQAGSGSGANGDDDDDFGDFDEASVAPAAAPVASTSAQASASAAVSSQAPPKDPYGRIAPPPDFKAAFAAAPPGEPALDTLTRIVDDFFKAAYPELTADWGDDSDTAGAPEKDYSGLSADDILLGKRGESNLRDTFEEMMKPIQPIPWDWRKSKTRLYAMREAGLPVNLDDFSDPPAKPMAPLVLPSLKTTLPSPSASSSTTARASSSSRHGGATTANGKASTSTLKSPVSRSGSPSSARPPSRSSTPAHSLPALPPIDLERCRALAEKSEQNLGFMSVKELEALREDLQRTAVDASNHLRGLLERKETLQGQNAGYNAMIQDLVVAAQKMHVGGSSSSASRKPSIKRTNSNTSTPKPAPGVGLGSGPNSRPASPGGGGLRASLGVGGKTVAGSSSAGKEQVRRSSLW